MKKILSLIIIIALIFSFAGCKNNPQTTSKENEKFKVLLDWTPNTNHIGLYVAQEKGYYKDMGLDVEILSADGANTLEMLALGNGDVGISFQESVTMARTATTPLNVKAIAAILQENTSGFASMKSKNITTAKDLENKKYGSWGTDIEEAMLKSVMEKNNADFSKVNSVISNALDTLTLIKEEADFAWIYYGWDGIIAETKGEKLNFMLMQDLDSEINFYSPLIATSDETINNKSKQLKKFLSATKKGYEYAINNVDESAKILKNASPDLDEQVLINSLNYLKPYMLNKNGEWGKMDTKVWEGFTNWMLKNKIINTELNVEDLYTNSLL